MKNRVIKLICMMLMINLFISGCANKNQQSIHKILIILNKNTDEDILKVDNVIYLEDDGNWLRISTNKSGAVIRQTINLNDNISYAVKYMEEMNE